MESVIIIPLLLAPDHLQVQTAPLDMVRTVPLDTVRTAPPDTIQKHTHIIIIITEDMKTVITDKRMGMQCGANKR